VSGAAPRPNPTTGAFTVGVRQSLNQPPILIAKNEDDGKTLKLWDPNPQFAQMKLGEASVYKWKDSRGDEWTGGLVKPPDYVAGRRYPLLLQTHGFNAEEFLTDGYSPTATAARPIAGRGIVVLQIGEKRVKPEDSSTPQEVLQMRDGYAAAIEQLNADGLIDPQRVGIIGFSRTGWYSLDALIHNGKYFQAATIAESTYISFGEYTLNADYGGSGRVQSILATIGPAPFGEGLKKWMSDSPGFNTEKINMPVLFQANNPAGLLYAWDIYALMRLQNKPVDLQYIRNGEHVLVKPLERLASQEINVDWYDFWLNGHEDPNPKKADQYARWRELKRIQVESR